MEVNEEGMAIGSGVRRDQGVAAAIAGWAAELDPAPDDLELARRALLDTAAVAIAVRTHSLTPPTPHLTQGGRWAVHAHLLDYDDLHLPSTSHISAVCVPAALAPGGDERAYLAGAGAMARLGGMLGWSHYRAGWHATCTAGAPAAAVAAAVALGLQAQQIETALALAIPAAGGVQSAFGTAAKSLQVGFAVDAGIRAARLAAAGATADPAAVDQWLTLVGGRAQPVPDRPAVPGGLAVKLFPCCYALQRPMHAVRIALGDRTVAAAEVVSVAVSAPRDAVRPLIHDRPATGLQGKFSMQYGVAAAMLDARPGVASFSDQAVARAGAQRIVDRVTLETIEGGGGLLAGEVGVDIRLRDGSVHSAVVERPPGAPTQPLSPDHLRFKLDECAGREAPVVAALTWQTGAEAFVELVDGGSAGEAPR